MAATEAFTPLQRQQRASVAAFARWAKEGDATAATQPCRDAFLARFEREVDPNGTLPSDERTRRALLLRKSYMRGLALKSSRKRGAQAASTPKRAT